MSDQKDSGIKLFGRVIPLLPDAAPGPPEPEVTAGADHPPAELQAPAPPEAEPEADKVSCVQSCAYIHEREKNERFNLFDRQFNDQHKETEDKEGNEMKVDVPQEKEGNEMSVDAPQETEDNEMEVNAPQAKENAEPDSSSTLDSKKEDHDQLSNAEDKGASEPNEENEKAANDESGQDKVLKKPDKIIPCPRCNSMDTKFCYYNNYNVNQPRHFCKNCQRYWTAGGTMRNVPVGAGRRKSKNSSLHYRHLLMAPDSMMGSRVDIGTNTMNPEALASLPSIPAQSTSRNETVLKFGQEVPLCESMASALNIEEQNVTNAGPVPQGENREDNSCASSITSYNGLPQSVPQNDQNGAPIYCNGVGPPPQYYLGAPFMYPWSIGWNNLPLMVPGGSMPESASPSEICSTTSAPWMNSPMMPGSRHPAPAFPYPLVPPALWGCLPSWPATAWNTQWINGCQSPSASSNSSCSGNGSPTLGKHSRDPNPLREDKEEKSLWVPKTLRIVDPDEAAKSSIWATLGIKPGNPGVFKPFQSKGGSKGQTSDAQPGGVLHANPAAFSRSQSFLESS